MATTNNTIVHFTHPEHRLAECNDEKEYLCDGCKTPGFGKRYRCHACDFDLHEYCGTCPQNLSIFHMHPHSLTLLDKALHTHQNKCTCNVCHEFVEGLFYRCNDCDFDLHPIYTKLPESLTHVLQQVHPLRLEAPPSSSTCAICREVCDSWRYRCGLCSFDIHPQCILVSCEQSSWTTECERLTIGPQHPFHQQPSPFPSYGSFHPPPQHGHGAFANGFQVVPVPFGPQDPFHQQPLPFPSYGSLFHPHPQHGHAAFPHGFPVGPVPYPMHHGYAPQPAPQTGGAATQAGGAATTRRGLRRTMFSLGTKLVIGVASNFIFGVGLSSFG